MRRTDGVATGHASFPASDPPATWTWDPPAPRPVVVDGSSPDAIALGAQLAEAFACELRVQTTPRARGARALVLSDGHAARRRQSDATCPLVVAPPGYASAGSPAIRYIGCGFDTSPASHAAWSEACALTRAVRGELHVYAVREQHAIGIPGTTMLAGDLGAIDRELGNFLHRELTRLVSTADLDLCIETVMASGSPGQILHEATRTLDLLVIGASRHGTIGSLLFGSVARGLLTDAHCPVMVVP